MNKYRVRYNQMQYNDCSGNVTPKSAIVSADDPESARAFIRETKKRVGLVFDAEPVFLFSVTYVILKYGYPAKSKTTVIHATDPDDARGVVWKRYPDAAIGAILKLYEAK